MNRGLRIAAVAVVAAALAALLFPLYLWVRAGDNQIIEPQPFDFVLVAIAAFAIAFGAQLVPWRAPTRFVFLGTLVAAGLLLGVLGIFSIGALILPIAVVLLVILARAVNRGSRGPHRSAALGGAFIGYGLVLLFIALIVPATVECRADGAGSTSSQRWRGGDYTVRSSGSSSPGGLQTGIIETSTSIATYRCEKGKLVEFHRESR